MTSPFPCLATLLILVQLWTFGHGFTIRRIGGNTVPSKSALFDIQAPMTQFAPNPVAPPPLPFPGQAGAAPPMTAEQGQLAFAQPPPPPPPSMMMPPAPLPPPPRFTFSSTTGGPNVHFNGKEVRICDAPSFTPIGD